MSISALRGKTFPSERLTAMKEKVSLPLRAKKYHQVIPHNNPHTRDWERHKMVGASAWVRRSKEVSRGGCIGLYAGLLVGWSYPGWLGIKEIFWPDLLAG